MKKKPMVHKRMIAYLVDILVVSVIASLISMFLPKNELYKENVKELSDVVIKYQNKEISEEEYLTLYDELNYHLSKNSVDTTIVIVIVTVLYFVLVNYYNDGQTIGKKLMKLKIVSNKESKLTINNYIIRCLICNTALSNVVSVILIMTLSKDNYLVYSNKISTAFSILYIICFVLILYRNDGRGLHDMLASSKVINAYDKEKEDDVKEAEVVLEKVDNNKEIELKENNKDKKEKVSKKDTKSKKNNKSNKEKNKTKKSSKGSEK